MKAAKISVYSLAGAIFLALLDLGLEGLLSYRKRQLMKKTKVGLE